MPTKTQTRLIPAAAIALLLALSPTPATAKTPTTLMVHGVLYASAGGGVVADGTYNMRFSIYSQPQGGIEAWSEGPVKVDVIGGRFAYNLGSVQPLSAKLFAGLPEAWLAFKLGVEPELPRQAIRAVAYAMVAAGLSCTGCVAAAALAPASIGADKISFNYAGAKSKGGPASSASDLSCTGCVSVSEMAFDGDINAAGQAIQAKSIAAQSASLQSITAQKVTASTYIGDGSQLTGVKPPAASCPGKFDVVHGIKADGSLDCVAGVDPAQAAGGSLSKVSNGVLTNEFFDGAKSTAPIPIPDNSPPGVGAELDFPDIGLAQGFEVDVDISNSDVSTIQVELWDPQNGHYLLHNKTGKGGALVTSFPLQTPTVSGDLSKWVGKNPVGKWRMRVIDWASKGSNFDGAINSWGIRLKTLSNKKVLVTGALQVAKTITGSDGAPATMGNGVYINVTSKPPGCDAAHKGLLYFDGLAGHLVVCDGSCYQVLATSKGGQCAAQTCQPGAKLCDGDTVVKCDSNGWTATTVEVCKEPKKYCYSGACSDKKCVLSNQPKYKGSSISMNTHSHGGGFHPFFKEYWYPDWSSGVVYRFDKAYQSVGSFSSGQKNMMQMWGDKDSPAWYSANWSANTVNRRTGKGGTKVWTYNIGSTAGGVTADATQVYAMRHNSMQLWILNKTNGQLIKTVTLTGGTMGTLYGSLVVWGDKLYRGNNAGNVFRYDLGTNKYDGMTFKTKVNIYNMAFNGQEYCVSANSTAVDCYDLFGATCPQ